MKDITIEDLEEMLDDDHFKTVAYGMSVQGFTVEELIDAKVISLTKKMVEAAKNKDHPKVNCIEAQLTGVLAIKDLLPCCRYVWKYEKPIEQDYIKMLKKCLEVQEADNSGLHKNDGKIKGEEE